MDRLNGVKTLWTQDTALRTRDISALMMRCTEYLTEPQKRSVETLHRTNRTNRTNRPLILNIHEQLVWPPLDSLLQYMI